MGSRRVRDLLALGHEVAGFDVRPDRCSRAVERFDIPVANSLQHLLNDKPDALVFSTPPDEHAKCYQSAYEARLPFFSEASILTPSLEWLSRQEARSGVRGYCSATWRFYAPLVELRNRLRTMGADRIQSIHHEYADYLPRWHPWENYWEFYAGRRRATSAAREMVPFEFEWLCWLFGEVASVSAEVARLGRWRSDIDDAYFITAVFNSGQRATVRIELYREMAARVASVCGVGESFRLDFNSDTLLHYDSRADSVTGVTVPESNGAHLDLEKVYAAEIACFARSIALGDPFPKSWREDRHLSDILIACEHSSRERRWVDIAEVAQQYDGLSVD